jgi:hypothetical protein
LAVLLLPELLRLALVFEREVVLFFAPLELELDLVGMTLSLPKRAQPAKRWRCSCVGQTTLLCSPIVLHEQIGYGAVFRRGSAAAARAE